MQKTGIAAMGALAFIFALTGEISADVRFGLHVSVEADGGGDLGVHLECGSSGVLTVSA